MVKLIIGDSSILIRLGIKTLLNDTIGFNFLADANSKEELFLNNKNLKPDLLIVDLESLMINESEIGLIKKQNKKVKILGISKNITKKTINHYLNQGVTSFLLKDCDKEEITDAINSTLQGLRFLCGKIAHALSTNDLTLLTPEQMKLVSCEGLIVSEREVEVIKHISNGLSNKQIADTMCLSTHTVNTHRKNIMNKLGVNNTAGIVMYAVRNNLLENNPYLFSN
jgi:DNA-binding NarL/FixJ family response regulator